MREIGRQRKTESLRVCERVCVYERERESGYVNVCGYERESGVCERVCV